jgi:[protein-PII] uridylyltransferase
LDEGSSRRFSGDLANAASVVAAQFAALDEDLLASSAKARSARRRAGKAADTPHLDGVALGRRRTAMLDELVVRMFVAAVAKTGVTEPIALAAVGSYGRGAVALRSDIDVRLVTKDGHRRREAAAQVADALLYPLWDAGLSVGHQVTSQSEVLELAQTDLATATSLLDLRVIAGDASLVKDLVDRAYLGLFSEGELGRFVDRLEEEASARHARFGESLYLLEPEVKSGAGGLRDIDIARWAARARYRVGADPWQELVRLGVIVPREAQEMARAEELLWRVRNRLHAHAGRKSDRLTFDQQETIAIELGYARKPSSPPGEDEDADAIEAAPSSASPEARAEAAERFMQEYFGHARIVSRSREALLLRAKPPKRRGKPVESDLGNGVRLFDGQVTVDSHALLDDPALALRVYDACIRQRAPVLPFARDLIARFAADPTWAARLRASREAARLFLSLLCTVPEAPLKRGSVVGELHEVGLLLAMIPEFQPVTGRVHHDVYHVYTVDVHSVAAVDCLRAICRGDLAHERPLASRLAAELARPIPLFVATLLHDVGKGYPDASGSRKNHSVSGAELCDTILPRLGVTGEDAAEIRSLVLGHLAMYHVATRRDLDDPTTVRDFVPQVHGREGLRNLYLLTVADITTTSPTAMTSWKARMLDELYFAADAHLTGRSDTHDAARIEKLRAAALSAWTGRKAEVGAFLQTMPERYILSHAPESIVAHARVALERTGPVHAALVPSRHPEVSELCVVAEDAPGLLAKIAAAITAARLEVLGAQVYSRNLRAAGRAHEMTEAVDLFWVRGHVEQAMPRLLRDLDALCSRKMTADELIKERLGTGSPWRERPSPAVLSEVVVDDRASPNHTVVEVFAKDRPGLLYSLARGLHGLGLSIALSKINTEGTKVADVFYVNELDGSKVAPGPRFKAIREALLDAARGGAEVRESMRA